MWFFVDHFTIQKKNWIIVCFIPRVCFDWHFLTAPTEPIGMEVAWVTMNQHRVYIINSWGRAGYHSITEFLLWKQLSFYLQNFEQNKWVSLIKICLRQFGCYYVILRLYTPTYKGARKFRVRCRLLCSWLRLFLTGRLLHLVFCALCIMIERKHL